MSLESELMARAGQHFERIFKPVAPVGTETPYLCWQHMGGPSLRFVDNSQPDKRQAFIQFSVWADDSEQAFALLRDLERTLMVVTDGQFVAVPMEEPTDGIDDGERIAGAVQSFSITGMRT